MFRIGFADYFLNNWHCDHYPDFLRHEIARQGLDMEVTHAYAFLDMPPEGGIGTEEWCRQRDMIPCASMEELIDTVDAVMVIAADDAVWHDTVCPLPLKSGKPVFVDKTFASSLQKGRCFFDLARENGTPVFSSSAQRYCRDILEWRKAHPEKPRFVSTVGPHSIDRYAVHQLEVISALMGTGVRRVKAFSVGSMVTDLILDYGGGRLASFVQSPQPYAEFNFMVSDGETGARLKSEEPDFYYNLADAILQFFGNRVPPVREEETLEILAVIDIARQARLHPDTWYDMPRL